MPIDVSVSTIIDRPVPVVAAVAVDPDMAPRWYANIDSTTWRTKPPLTPGSEMEFTARFLGRLLRYVYRVTEYLPDRRLVMQTVDGQMRMQTTYEWEALGSDATRMTLTNRGDSPPGMRWLTPLARRGVQRATTKDLAALKAPLEKS